MKRDDPMRSELEVLLALLVEGELSMAQRDRLGAILKASPDARLFYKRYLEVHAMLQWESGSVMGHHASPGTLDDLLQMEEHAHAELVHQVGLLDVRRDERWDFRGAWRYAVRRPVLWGGLAAALALPLLLVVLLWGGGVEPTELAVEPVPRTIAPEQRLVATLTAVHEAQWQAGSGVLLPNTGDDLHAGQRLTLISGFAEITTAEGAVAVFEAPATFELTDSENALILHSGTLVGICETPSSKGFLVQAPHMEIMDLGTRFGVDADDEVTSLHVFKGEVETARTLDGFHLGGPQDVSPIKLKAGEAARASADSDQITLHDADLEHFAMIMPERQYFLGSTGLGLAVNDIDPAWRITAIDGRVLETPISMHVFDDPPTRTFGPSDASWVGIKTSDLQWNLEQVRYTVQTRVEIPDSIEIMDSTALLLRFHPDDEVTAMFVNGHAVDIPVNHVMVAGQVYEIRVSDYITSGVNEIQLEIADYKTSEGQDNYAGIRASLKLLAMQSLFEQVEPAAVIRERSVLGVSGH